MISKNKHNILGVSLENYFPKSLNGVEFLINAFVCNFTL